VEAWFGHAFADLHPNIQALHRAGGILRGPVEVRLGRNGVARWIGKRLATRLGVPQPHPDNHMEVSIFSDGAGLHWNRRFNGGSEFRSLFRPVGHYPSGRWIESSGAITLALQVAVRNGAWHWEHVDTRLFGIPLPRWLMPRTAAYKDVRDGMYIFSVNTSVPLLGTVLSYCGTLSATPI